MNQRKGDKAIHILVWIAVAGYYALAFWTRGFSLPNSGLLVAFSATVLVVHLIKAFRLYFALYGTNIPVKTYWKIYCEVTPASMILPLKIGELFRMYCYGRQIKSLLRGSVIVLMDRFMDTAALLTILVLSHLTYGGKLTGIMWLLLLFILGITLCYFIFPGIYHFWKGYLLHAKASRHKIEALKLLESFMEIYVEVEKVIRGRGTILYFLSLIAWGNEIGGVLLLHGFNDGQSNLGKAILNYLSTAISGIPSDEFRWFTLISVISLIFLYLLLQIAGSKPAGKGEIL